MNKKSKLDILIRRDYKSIIKIKVIRVDIVKESVMYWHRALSSYLICKIRSILGIHIVISAADRKKCVVNSVFNKIKAIIDNVEVIERITADVIGLLSVVKYKAYCIALGMLSLN